MAAKIRGEIHGSNVDRRAPRVSHLLFADDSFLFFKVSMDECSVIKNILGAYERISCQSVNFQKIWNFLQSKCGGPSSELGVSSPLNIGRYLGLWKKLQSWKHKFLSRVRKEILLKAIALAIPT